MDYYTVRKIMTSAKVWEFDVIGGIGTADEEMVNNFRTEAAALDFCFALNVARHRRLASVDTEVDVDIIPAMGLTRNWEVGM